MEKELENLCDQEHFREFVLQHFLSILSVREPHFEGGESFLFASYFSKAEIESDKTTHSTIDSRSDRVHKFHSV